MFRNKPRTIDEAITAFLNPFVSFLQSHVDTNDEQFVEHKTKAAAHARLAKQHQSESAKARTVLGNVARLTRKPARRKAEAKATPLRAVS